MTTIMTTIESTTPPTAADPLRWRKNLVSTRLTMEGHGMSRVVRNTFWSMAMCLVCMVMNGCSFGAKALRGDRPDYNMAIQHSEKEEILLNLVRVRYGESVKFLQVASIVSSLNYSASINASGTVFFGQGLDDVLNIFTGLNYSEAPTITYLPLEGTQFVTQMLTGASVETMSLLLQSGWNVAQVSSIMVERIGQLPNAPELPSYGKFQRLIKLLDTIQTRGDLTFRQVYLDNPLIGGELPPDALDFHPLAAEGATWAYKPIGDGKFQILKIGGPTTIMELKYSNEAEAETFAGLIGVPSSRPRGKLIERIRLIDALHIPFQPDTYPEPVTELTVHLRSFTDQLLYLTQGVDIPESDKRLALPAAMQKLDFMRVQHSDARPDHAYVAVPYRGRWFSIADDDLQSKGTMALLLMVLSLQTTGGGAAPSLTLPIGG